MECVQRDLIRVLLDHVCSLGLISRATYLGAVDLVYAGMELPALLRDASFNVIDCGVI